MSIPFTVSVTFNAEDQLIEIYSSGEADPEKVKSMYMEAVSLAEKHQVKRILVDVLNIILSYDSDNIYKVVNFLADICKGYKIARVTRMDNFKQDLIEEMSADRNLQLRNFEHKEQALEWLLSQ